MNNYERLLNNSPVCVMETDTLPKAFKGLYAEVLGKKIILIKDGLTLSEKYCVLAEELGHYHTSAGDITDQSKLNSRIQEKRARSWSYEKLVPLEKIVQAHKHQIKNKCELADFLGVTECFLGEALERYKEKYGLSVEYKDYNICFEPLGVIEWFDKFF